MYTEKKNIDLSLVFLPYLYTASSYRLLGYERQKKQKKMENVKYKKRVKKWMTRFVDDADAPL